MKVLLSMLLDVFVFKNINHHVVVEDSEACHLEEYHPSTHYGVLFFSLVFL